jgi:homeobox protein cut-like
MDKNKSLQADNTSLRAENAQLKGLCESMESKVVSLEENKSESDALVQKLEMDLMLVQSPASVTRSAADGMPATKPVNMSSEFLSDAIKDTTGTASSDNSLLMIVTSQRERFRLRNNELESENYGQQQLIQQLQNEMDGMRADNVKLYEKIRFLQSYPNSKTTAVPMEDQTSNRYSSQYEEHLDPFTSFNRKEKQRKYMNLSPPEKVTLGIGKMILSSKLARTIFFFYMLFMHILLYIVLYKYSYVDDYKHHIADICYERFGAQMAPNPDDAHGVNAQG